MKKKNFVPNKRTLLETVIYYIIACTALIITIIPLSLLVLSSLKSGFEFYSNPLGLPKIWSFKNYTDAWVVAKFYLYFINSIIFSIGSVLLCIFISSMAAFAFTRFGNKATKYLMPMMLVGNSVPVLTLMIPLYFLCKQLGLTNSYIGIILVYAVVSISYAIYIIAASMKSVPNELVESAIIDGCNAWGVFINIFFPLVKPAMFAVGIAIFIQKWNEFILAVVLNSDSKYYPMTVGLLNFKSNQSTNMGAMAAGCVIAVSIPLVIFLFAQKQIVEGLTDGAVKG